LDKLQKALFQDSAQHIIFGKHINSATMIFEITRYSSSRGWNLQVHQNI